MAERERILVVEDAPALAELLRAHLAAAGDAAQVVSDGLATLRAFEQERPAQVTLDLTVPTISGFRLVRLFRQWRPEIPVLVVSGLAFDEAEDMADSGADDLLTKPSDPELLVQKVRTHLRAPGRLPASAVATSHPPLPSRELVLT